MNVDGFILRPPRAYPYPVHLNAAAVFTIVELLDLAFGATRWPSMN